MGKKVFEVAKELGVDHRELLKQCDTLNIDVRNYMSVLTDEQESRLRGSVEVKRKVVEQVQAPGVVRRRRKKVTPSSGRPPALKAQPLTAKVPVTTDEAPVKPPSEPKVAEPSVAEEPSVVETPAKVVEAPAPAQEKVETPVEPKEAPAEPKAPAPAEPEVAAETAEKAEPAEPKAPAAPAAGPTAPVSKIRKPTSAGGAKVLGSIPLEQLQQRTARPQRRSPARPQGGPGRGGPGRGGPAQRGGPPGGGNRGGGAPTWDAKNAQNMPPMPPQQEGRRRKAGAQRPGGEADRDQQKRTASRRRQVFSREDIYRGSARGGRGRKRKASSKKGLRTQITTPAAHKRVVRVDETISVGELGKALGVKTNELIGKLVAMGSMVTINDQIDIDTATLLATEYDYEVKNVAFDEEEILSGPSDEAAVEADPDALPRAPVVTVMGHVDHGKTTLLDRIRAANVADGEAGGITQHIAAYKVKVDDKEVTFLDTPGHAAFAAMRARGASVTDIVVLIVAADDGVMPQTEESINHAKAAGVPLVVAINKCDKPGVDPERIKQEMTQFELVPEEWGGDTMFMNISALKGEGVQELLEALALQADVLELKANPKKPAYGRVVEARMEKGRGNVCTILVQEGTLKKGDFVVAGNHFGRVRTMMSDTGAIMTEAGPSTPVEVIGIGGLPAAGESFHIVKNERDAKKVISSRVDKARAEANQPKEPVDPMALLEAFGKPEAEKQNVILKADVAGSYEAIKLALDQLSTEEVEVRLLHGGVGPIIQSDVDLAVASGATVIGFNVATDGKAKRTADQEGVGIFNYSIIYELIDGVKDLLSGLLSPDVVEEYVGRAEVRAVFHIQKVGAVAGCSVVDGKVLRNATAKVTREGEELLTGKIHTLKRFKDDVREVANGYECGIAIEGYKQIAEGDVIEVIEVKEIQRTID